MKLKHTTLLCTTIEQMELVNTFCWLEAYSDSLLSGKGPRAGIPVEVGAE